MLAIDCLMTIRRRKIGIYITYSKVLCAIHDLLSSRFHENHYKTSKLFNLYEIDNDNFIIKYNFNILLLFLLNNNFG
jgi:hypothetical protein